MHPMWAYMVSIFQMRKTEACQLAKRQKNWAEESVWIQVRLVSKWLQNVSRWLELREEEGAIERWGKLWGKLCKKGEHRLGCEARHLSRCRGGPTGQEDKGKCGRGATVIAGVSGLKGRLHPLHSTSLPLYPTHIYTPERRRLFSTGLIYSRKSPGTNIFSHFQFQSLGVLSGKWSLSPPGQPSCSTPDSACSPLWESSQLCLKARSVWTSTSVGCRLSARGLCQCLLFLLYSWPSLPDPHGWRLL